MPFELKKEFSEYSNKSLRLPNELIDKVQQLANQKNTSFNKVVIHCIEFALDNLSDEEIQ